MTPVLEATAKLKANLKTHAGGTGFLNLQRKFKIMDDDGSRSLSLAEFKKALKELRVLEPESSSLKSQPSQTQGNQGPLHLNEAELRMLFDSFDRDGSGSIDFDEFIYGVRDPISKRRLALVDLAFSG